MPAKARFALVIALAIGNCQAVTGALAAGCVIDSTPCRGCGCKGGPGYRHLASGQCVSFRDLAKKCGNPPGVACSFENAPGTGANRECAFGGKVQK